MYQIEELTEEVKNCRRCTLWKTRKNPVLGSGDPKADIMLIGEAPGRNEDMKGKPFVGEAGKILDQLLSSIDLRREKVYITNILKCRPPGNRNPSREEIEACTPFLDRQIEFVNPWIIVTLGNFATRYILEKFNIKAESIGRIHGRIFNLKAKNLKIVPMYHPASALYNPRIKGIMIDDFRVIGYLTESI